MGAEKRISASDANRRFSEMLRDVSRGQTYVVTSHGKEVARISPIGDDAIEAKRRAAREAHLARLMSQPVLNLARTWKREDLYD